MRTEGGPMNRTLISGLAVALAALTAACGRSTSQSDFEQTPRNSPVTLTVTNNHMQDITVFVLAGADRMRMGTITTGQTETFTVPSVAVRSGSDFQMLVHPIGGGGDYATDRVTVSPGD